VTTRAPAPGRAVRVGRPAALHGTLAVPGDKSLSHRALLFNALASGEARVTGLGLGEDVRSTRRCLEALGVAFLDEPDGSVVVRGRGASGLDEPEGVLDCGNSGTTMRLLLGILAGQEGRFAVLDGDASLRRRPMARVLEPLGQMGALGLGRQGGTLAPLAIRGARLRAIEHRSPVASAQLKSALLLAGVQAEGVTTVIEPSRSRDHTERMLAAMGAAIQIDGAAVAVRGPVSDLRPLSFHVPGDFSSAAFWLVLACCHPQSRVTLRGVGVNPTRTGLLDVLREMGARIALEHERLEGGEPVADLVVESSPLRAVSVGGAIIPRLIDEIPVLAVAAAFAAGETRIRDAEELRIKESDRLATTARELARLGVDVTEERDGLTIRGGRPLHCAAVESHGDHRLAMAAAVAAAAGAGATIEGASAASVSYPSFWDDLRELGAEVVLE